MQTLEQNAPVEAPIKLPTQTTTDSRRFRWDADLLYKLEGAGVFGDARIELIEGEVIEMSPIGPRHAAVTAKITTTLIPVFAIGYVVFPQNPVKLSGQTVPQPDVMVLRGTFADYFDTLPETAVLMVEVADSTLASDRRDKTSLYARYDIQELWIVNVAGDEIEIYREPRADAAAIYGFSYGLRQVLGREGAVSPLEMPLVSIPITDLLI